MALHTRVPHPRRIGRGPETKALYAAEERSTAAFAAAARRLEEVLLANKVIVDPVDHFRQVRPEAIFTFLEGQEDAAALAACFGFIAWMRAERPEKFREAIENWVEQRGAECPTCSLQIVHWMGLKK